ncbi:hypothetical protein [Rouxiella badensis]|uniref:hypothetical protein n=1 Tax=Rouxiella badensis TaxID=1646377 RepID=UPI001787DA74|nr:hypothetical protein [Rouxiella badensis]QOI56609.1 hypothetical protein H2866_05610 [Rouxiella badensis subsp. acadiensis]
MNISSFLKFRAPSKVLFDRISESQKPSTKDIKCFIKNISGVNNSFSRFLHIGRSGEDFKSHNQTCDILEKLYKNGFKEKGSNISNVFSKKQRNIINKARCKSFYKSLKHNEIIPVIENTKEDINHFKANYVTVYPPNDNIYTKAQMALQYAKMDALDVNETLASIENELVGQGYTVRYDKAFENEDFNVGKNFLRASNNSNTLGIFSVIRQDYVITEPKTVVPVVEKPLHPYQESVRGKNDENYRKKLNALIYGRMSQVNYSDTPRIAGGIIDTPDKSPILRYGNSKLVEGEIYYDSKNRPCFYI